MFRILAFLLLFSSPSFAGPFSLMQEHAAEKGVTRSIQLSPVHRSEADVLLSSVRPQMEELLAIMAVHAGKLAPEIMREEVLTILRAFALDASRNTVKRGLLPKGPLPADLRKAVRTFCSAAGWDRWIIELEDALSCLIAENAVPPKEETSGYFF